RAVHDESENDVRNLGVRVIHKRGMHERLVLIDGAVLWQGNLDPLSFGSSRELMERRVGSGIVAEYRKGLRLDDPLGAYPAPETPRPDFRSQGVPAPGPTHPLS